MAISAPRLRRSRHGVYALRFIVPQQLRDFLGKNELRRSLGTKDGTTARLIALHLNAQIETALQYFSPQYASETIKKTMDKHVFGWKIVAKDNGDIELITDGTPEDAASAAYHAARELGPILGRGRNAGPKLELAPSRHHELPEKPLRIGEAIASFSSAYELPNESGQSGVVISKANSDRKTTMRVFEEFISNGGCHEITLESFVHELDTECICTFVNYYAQRQPKSLKPNNRRVRVDDDMNVLPDSTQGRAAIENKTLSTSTLHKQKSNISGFLNFCRAKKGIKNTSELFADSFGKDIERTIDNLTSKNRKSGSYAPFDHTEIQKMFEPEIYFWCGRGQVEYFWAPLISLFMGLRGKEIATLTLKSVREHRNLGVFTIQLFEDRTKNDNSAREIPIPDGLIRIGFIDYVKWLHAQTQALTLEERDGYPLFPSVDISNPTFLADPHKNVSRFFSVYRRMKYLELDMNIKVFHSFRHTVVSVLEAMGVETKAQMQIVGHTEAEDGVALPSKSWAGKVKSMQVQTSMIYTKEVDGFDTTHSLQRNKLFLDRLGELFGLNYEKLNLAAKTAQSLLVCQDLSGKKWSGGFKINQKALIAQIPDALIPKDMKKVEDFSWR